MSVPEQWRDFLREDHADTAAFGPGAEAVSADLDLLCDLSDRGLIRIAGADAQGFLQGQLSNDVRKVDAGHSQLTSYSNPKGRMIANGRLLHRDDAYWLFLTQSMAEPVRRRLSMFVLRSKVEISDGGEALARFGLAGPKAAQLLSEAGLRLPAAIDAVACSGDVSVVRVACLSPRYEILAPAPTAIDLWRQLARQARPTQADAWALLDIKAGLATIYPQTSEAFVAQMANYELVDGVSFTKGCYTGQEVIARTHYLGKPKRRMYGFSVRATAQPQPGGELISVSASPPQAVGTIVDARRLNDGEYLGLAVIQKSHLGDRLRLNTSEGEPVEVRALPYPVEADAADSGTPA